MSKEILCPVCEKEISQSFVDGLYYGIYCSHIDGQNKSYIDKTGEFIQSRIDRAVEEAVRKERERVLGWITENEITILNNDFEKGWNGAMDSIKNLVKQG